MRVEIGEFLQPDQIQPLKSFALCRGLVHVVDLQAEHHILFDRQPGEQGVALEYHAAVTPRTGDGIAFQQNLAAGLFLKAGEDADQGGLATAGRADDAEEFAPMGLKVDVAQSNGFGLSR